MTLPRGLHASTYFLKDDQTRFTATATAAPPAPAPAPSKSQGDPWKNAAADLGEMDDVRLRKLREKERKLALKFGEPEGFGGSDLRDRFLGLAFSPITASSLEKKAMMTLTCTEFDSFGEVKANSVKYLKSDLCSMHGIESRDLRTVCARPFRFLFITP